MSGFAGFTDADIRKVQNGQVPTLTKIDNESQNKTISNIARQKRGIMVMGESRKEKALNDMIKRVENDNNVMPEEARLSLPKQNRIACKDANGFVSKSNDSENNESSSNKNAKKSVHFDDGNDSKLSQNKQETYNHNNGTNNLNIVEVTTNSNDAATKKPIDFEEFQSRQKLMEEQNRRRKELLAKALADRTKRSQQEQQRLNEIQNDFKKLDASLSNDVKILRKQIETASLDYMEAQKRYHKIEREFLDAKLYLHQKLEKKEMLTEHLCAIIEKNEERKADKLNELLLKLEVNDGGGVQDEQVSTSQD